MRYLASKTNSNTLTIIDEFEIETFRTLPNGTTCYIDLKISRKPQFHRKFRGFLNTVYQTIPYQLHYKYPTFEVFWKAILIATGMYRFRKTKSGHDIEFKSTAFGSMKEDDYRKFVREVIELIDQDYFQIGDHDSLIELLEEYKYY